MLTWPISLPSALILVMLVTLKFVICSHQPQQFYIYPFPRNLVDTWPPYNMTRKVVENTIFDQSFKANGGYGPVLKASDGMFQTWQFSLFRLVYHRLIRSPLRTRDPRNASVFFIPYDGGIDATVSSYDGRLLKNRCPRSGQVGNLLKSSKYFSKNNGRDHFLVFSVIQGVSSLLSPGCRRLYQNICKECIKLTIEISYHNSSSGEILPIKMDESDDGTDGEQKNQAEKSNKSQRKPVKAHYDPTWISVPYPSSWHYWENTSIVPWKMQKMKRGIIAVFIGGSRTLSVTSNYLREILKRQVLIPFVYPTSNLTQKHKTSLLLTYR